MFGLVVDICHNVVYRYYILLCELDWLFVLVL